MAFSLGSAPNPFNPEAVISLQLPVVCEIELRVYDVLGREVAVLANEQRSAGAHRFVFNGSHLGSGVYFCRLSARGEDGKTFVQTVKLVLQK